MNRTRKTVAELREMKGKKQFTMLHVKSLDEAAGIDMLSIIDPLWTPEMRAAAPSCFVEFSADVAAGRYPAVEHIVGIADHEFAAFQQQLGWGFLHNW